MDLNKLIDLLKQISENTESVNKNQKNPIRMDENATAKLIAAIVRNQMEEFHSKYLSDEQMKELNPIIRNSIYTALVYMKEKPATMLGYYHLWVPDYWEDCKLLKL